MIPAEIITKALLDTYTDSSNYDPTTKGLEALNIVSDEINNDIATLVKEDFFWDYVKTDSVIGQSEYNIKEATVNWNGTDTTVNIKQINKTFIKYSTTDTYYKQLDYISPDIMTGDPDNYSDNQSEACAFYNVQDRSVFIYPAPSVVISEALKFNVIFTPPAILYVSVEGYLPIQPDKHYIYALGIAEHIYKSQGKINEAQVARQIFDKEKKGLIAYLRSRLNTPRPKTINNLNSFR